MRHVRAQEKRIRLAAQIDVVGILAGAGQKPHVLAPLGAGADAAVFGHVLTPLYPGDPTRRSVAPEPGAAYSAATAGTSWPEAARIARTML